MRRLSAPLETKAPVQVVQFLSSLGSEACISSVFNSELRLGQDKACALKSIMIFLGIRQFRIVHNYLTLFVSAQNFA